MRLLAPAPTLADAMFPAWDTNSRLGRLAHDAVLVLAFTGIVVLCAQIVFRLPWTTVPITGQTFAVLVTGGSLGAWRGATSLALYMFLGILGAPVFAPSLGQMEGQTAHFILPWQGTGDQIWDISSGGYILGFIAAAWLVGILSQRGWDRGQWLLVAFLAGNVVLYMPGLLWLAYLISTDWIHPAAGIPLGELISGGTTLEKTLVGGLYPFILGDLIKLYLATLALPTAWAIVRWRRR